MATTTTTHSFTTEDIEYLRHDGKPLLLRLFRPEGAGPYPAVVELHGGAWNNGDRTGEHFRHEALARAGFVVASLDFRQGSEGAYPKGVADINYAVRWVKANARDLRTRPDLIAISGQSSGGHLAMLVAMRPKDPRYTAIALPAGAPSVDATVRCVVMSWPVINPLGRYRSVKRGGGGADILQSHHNFWGTEAAMAEGSCMLALERGEKVVMPPALWLQTPNDQMHDYRDPESPIPGTETARFAANYRKAGGEIDLIFFDAPHRFTSTQPDSPAARQAFDTIIGFLRQHMPVG